MGQVVKYINSLGDKAPTSSFLTLGKEYEIQSLACIVEKEDAYRIINDQGQASHYFKSRFSIPFNYN